MDGPRTRRFLEREGRHLAIRGQDHYYDVRDRFNSAGDPLDFLFLNRSCFNGLVRFNKRGEFNVPFGHKPNRFARAYITKIVNQIEAFRMATILFDWRFACQDYRITIQEAAESDFVYCDPPYIGRHVDYYDSWDEASEKSLHSELQSTGSRFMLSTWHSNEHRENGYLQTLWKGLEIVTQEHFYHVGAQETNRKPMIEALVTNYVAVGRREEYHRSEEQLMLFERAERYLARETGSVPDRAPLPQWFRLGAGEKEVLVLGLEIRDARLLRMTGTRGGVPQRPRGGWSSGEGRYGPCHQRRGLPRDPSSPARALAESRSGPTTISSRGATFKGYVIRRLALSVITVVAADPGVLAAAVHARHHRRRMKVLRQVYIRTGSSSSATR